MKSRSVLARFTPIVYEYRRLEPFSSKGTLALLAISVGGVVYHYRQSGGGFELAGGGWGAAVVEVVPLLLIGWHLKNVLVPQFCRVRYPGIAERFGSWRNLVVALQKSGYRERLPNGRIAVERDHFFLGCEDKTGKAALLNKPIIYSHAHILGSTGSRKSHGALVPLGTQIVMRNEAHLVMVDLKGDMAAFMNFAIEAKRAGQPFKWFTLALRHSTYLFNPLTQSHRCNLSFNERVQGLLQPLGVEHGEGYGAGYFGTVQEKFISRVFEAYPNISSFYDLALLFRDGRAMKRLGLPMKEFADSNHVRGVIERLARVPGLNGVGVGDGVRAGAIDVRDIISKPGVTYFFLEASLEPTTARIVARYVPRLLNEAARLHRGPRVPVVCVIDEAQEMLQPDIGILVKQARDRNIALWFAHQDLPDLTRGSFDFGPVIQGNTWMKIVFAARDMDGQRYLAQTSGERREWLRANSETETDGEIRVGVSKHETVRPYLTPNLIRRLNQDDSLCVLDVAPTTGFTNCPHPLLVRVGFHISEREFTRRKNLGWPLGNPFTFTPKTDVPLPAARAVPEDDEEEEARGKRREVRVKRTSAPPATPAPAVPTPTAAPPPPAPPKKPRPATRVRDDEMDGYLKSLLDGEAPGEKP